MILRVGQQHSLASKLGLVRGVGDDPGQASVVIPAGGPIGAPMIFHAATRLDDYVLEDVIDAYVDWREQSQTVWLAYRRWLTASRAGAPLQFAAYLAELDQEERASAVYAATIDRTVEQL